MKNSVGVILDDFVASAYTLILILIIKFFMDNALLSGRIIKKK